MRKRDLLCDLFTSFTNILFVKLHMRLQKTYMACVIRRHQTLNGNVCFLPLDSIRLVFR